MLKIVKDFQGQTVIPTFETPPATAFDPGGALEAACQDCIRQQAGFIAAGLHLNDARRRICNYSQWRAREDCQAMPRTPEMRERNRMINTLCRGFAPVMHEVTAVF